VHCTLTTEKSGRRISLDALPNPEVGSRDQHLDIDISSPTIMNVALGMSSKPDYQAWKDWILNAPAEARYVYLEHPDVRRRDYIFDDDIFDEGYGAGPVWG
jgi:hypothetical protein